jgi:putative hemolysin
MDLSDTHLSVRLAETPDDVEAAQRLRYAVFVDELGASGSMVDHDARIERDEFDAVADHLLLEDRTRPGEVVGVYRLIGAEAAAKTGGFYSEGEYDLGRLKASGRRILELGRSCLHPDYRGGSAMLHLWQGLADYVLARQIDVLFGTASFHGTDVAANAHALSLLHYRFLAPAELRVTACARAFQRMDLVPEDEIDRAAAMRDTPALIKAYLRLGGCVGEGAFIDRAFNTIDVCLVMDTARMNEEARRRLTGVRT